MITIAMITIIIIITMITMIILIAMITMIAVITIITMITMIVMTTMITIGWHASNIVTSPLKSIIIDDFQQQQNLVKRQPFLL
jgi:hypothetical protein